MELKVLIAQILKQIQKTLKPEKLGLFSSSCVHKNLVPFFFATVIPVPAINVQKKGKMVLTKEIHVVEST